MNTICGGGCASVKTVTTMTNLWVDRWGLLSAGAAAGDTKDAVRRMQGSKAVKHRFIQANPRRMQNALVIDIDRASAVMDALEKPHDHPDPSWVIETDRGAHVGWWLASPVCRSEFAARRPVRYAARVQEGLIRTLGADPAYTGFITRNPVFPHLRPGEVIWGSDKAYELRDMRTQAMPRQLPRTAAKSRSDLGRNCALFEQGRHEVYALNRAMGYPGADALYRAALSHLLDLNGAIPTRAGGPLALNEVRCIARSMAKWTADEHTPASFSAYQAKAGAKGGKKSAEKRRDERAALVEEVAQ